jgi:amino acid transporter
MSARRIMGWVVIVAALGVFAYVGLEAVLILRGELEAGPLRLTTLALNVVTAIALLFLGRITLRPLPPRRK